MQNILKALLGNRLFPTLDFSPPFFKEGCLTQSVGWFFGVEFILKGLERPFTTPSKFDYVIISPPLLEKRRGKLGHENVLIFLTISLFSITPIFAKNETPIAKTEVDSLKRSEEKYWYADKPISEKKKEKTKPKTPSQSKNESKILEEIGSFFKIIVWSVLGAAVLFAIYIILNNLKDFKFKTNTKVTAISEENNEKIDIKDFETADFGSQIEKCINDNNYRLATRYYYLWVVKTLHEANLIAFSINKTNQDYTNELSKKAVFSKERLSHFMQCTNYYEHLWFGNFTVSETSFFRIENTFKDFINQKS